MVAILDANLQRPRLKPRTRVRGINTISRLRGRAAARLSRVTCLILAASRARRRIALHRVASRRGDTRANIDVSVARRYTLRSATFKSDFSQMCRGAYWLCAINVCGVDASVNDRSPVYDRWIFTLNTVITRDNVIPPVQDVNAIAGSCSLYGVRAKFCCYRLEIFFFTNKWDKLFHLLKYFSRMSGEIYPLRFSGIRK